MKTQDVIDRAIHVVVSQMDEAAKTSADIKPKSVFGDLQTSLAEFGPNNQVHKICDAMVYPDFLNLSTADTLVLVLLKTKTLFDSMVKLLT